MTQNIDVIEMVEKFGMTPAEATDYHAVKIKGYTQREWAEKRGLSGHQSVGRNVREAYKKVIDPRYYIDTVIVDPDDIIEALRYNRRPTNAGRRNAVIRITPPFESESEASIFYPESGHHYPSEMSPDPFHIAPEVFVGENLVETPYRSRERERAKDELDDPTEEDIEEYVETAFNVWEKDVRKHLCEKIDIYERTKEEEHVVSVTYE